MGFHLGFPGMHGIPVIERIGSPRDPSLWPGIAQFLNVCTGYRYVESKWNPSGPKSGSSFSIAGDGLGDEMLRRWEMRCWGIPASSQG